VKKNGHARPFGFLSRFFSEEDLSLHEQVERLQRVPSDLREIRLAVERGELCADDLTFDPDETDEVEPVSHPEKP
jgi:hypothetical protein